MCIFFPLGARASLEGENAAKTLLAVRTPRPPLIDGALGEEVWRAAPPDDRFTQRRPNQGASPTERTEVRVLYDDQAVYFGIRCHDRNARGIIARLTRRDRTVQADWVEITLDTRHDHRSAYVFGVNAAGVQIDGQFYDDGIYTPDWDAVWTSAVSIDDGGWNAELAIPLTVLRFSAARVQEWGLQIHRKIARSNEEMAWSHLTPEQQGWVSHFAHLGGLEGLKPRRTLELRPYAVARLLTRTEDGNPILGVGPGSTAEGDPDLGADLKVGITSGLTLDATINPDFGQVEADQVVLNLSRFETFFPEKRPFFLEGRDVFETPIQLFYPRRIAGRIWGAAKLAGNPTGGLSVGALSAVVDPELDGTGLRAYNVLRGRWSSGAHGVGLLATGRSQLEDFPDEHDGYLQAVDGFWSSASGRWRASGQFVLSERVGGATQVRSNGTRLDSGDVGWGAVAVLSRSTEHWFHEWSYRGFSPQLEVNDTGFLTEFDNHTVKVIPAYGQRTPCGIFNQWVLIPVIIGGVDHEGVLTDSILGVDGEMTFTNYVYLSAETFVRTPGNWDLHETLDGARYERVYGVDVALQAYSDSRKDYKVGLLPFLSKGLGEHAGWHAILRGELDWAPFSALQLELDPELSWSFGILRFVDCTPTTAATCLDERGDRRYRFADLDSRYLSLTLKSTYTLSTSLSMQAYAQLFYARGNWHDTQELTASGNRPFLHREDFTPSPDPAGEDFRDTALNVNLVLRWEPIPGSTLYGVYTRAQTSPVRSLRRGPTEEVVLLKFVYYLAP